MPGSPARSVPGDWPIGILALLLLVLFAGCHAEKQQVANLAPNNAGPFPRTLTDSRGKQIILPKPPQRIVSLAPSETEILYALGVGDKIVADTTACDYPPEAKAKPHIGGFDIRVEAVEAQNPDLVVAVGSLGRYQQKAVQTLESAHIPVLSVDPRTLAETYDSIRLLGRAVDRDAKAAQIVAQMQAAIAAVQTAVAGAPRPRVFICYGVTPSIYTTGSQSFIDDLITAAGGKNIVTAPAPEGNLISAALVVAAQPEVIIADPELQSNIKAMPGWAESVPAVKNDRFFFPANGDTLVRPGPRLAQGAQELARYLHPDRFPSAGKKP